MMHDVIIATPRLQELPDLHLALAVMYLLSKLFASSSQIFGTPIQDCKQVQLVFNTLLSDSSTASRPSCTAPILVSYVQQLEDLLLKSFGNLIIINKLCTYRTKKDNAIVIMSGSNNNGS